ncbi:MAG: XTP/dITP diphosphatase [Spirochaetota bacterium]
MKLVIATKNNNKINEIKQKFSDFTGLEIISLTDFNNLPDILEDGLTFEENAIKKAKAYSRFTGETVLSDDSGLEIDALCGEPGVRSARYSGENASDDENNSLVLVKLKKVPDSKRTARFVCVIAIVQPNGTQYTAKGTCNGIMTDKKAGSNGFGYDPIFYFPDLKKTMAELSLEEKNKISHRAEALTKAKVILKKIMNEHVK